jgi:hypothetical protein
VAQRCNCLGEADACISCCWAGHHTARLRG